MRLSTPRTWARPSYSPAGELAALAANGHSLPPTATVPNDCLSSTVPRSSTSPSLLLSARSEPDTRALEPRLDLLAVADVADRAAVLHRDRHRHLVARGAARVRLLRDGGRRGAARLGRRVERRGAGAAATGRTPTRRAAWRAVAVAGVAEHVEREQRAAEHGHGQQRQQRRKSPHVDLTDAGASGFTRKSYEVDRTRPVTRPCTRRIRCDYRRFPRIAGGVNPEEGHGSRAGGRRGAGPRRLRRARPGPAGLRDAA